MVHISGSCDIECQGMDTKCLHGDLCRSDKSSTSTHLGSLLLLLLLCIVGWWWGVKVLFRL